MSLSRGNSSTKHIIERIHDAEQRGTFLCSIIKRNHHKFPGSSSLHVFIFLCSLWRFDEGKGKEKTIKKRKNNLITFDIWYFLKHKLWWNFHVVCLLFNFNFFQHLPLSFKKVLLHLHHGIFLKIYKRVIERVENL